MPVTRQDTVLFLSCLEAQKLRFQGEDHSAVLRGPSRLGVEKFLGLLRPPAPSPCPGGVQPRILGCATPRQPRCPPAHGNRTGGRTATKATGLHGPPPKNKTQKESAKTRCRRCRSLCVLASSRREARGHRRHATAEALAASTSRASAARISRQEAIPRRARRSTRIARCTRPVTPNSQPLPLSHVLASSVYGAMNRSRDAPGGGIVPDPWQPETDMLPGKPQRSRRRSNRELYSAAPWGFHEAEG